MDCNEDEAFCCLAGWRLRVEQEGKSVECGEGQGEQEPQVQEQPLQRPQVQKERQQIPEQVQQSQQRPQGQEERQFLASPKATGCTVLGMSGNPQMRRTALMQGGFRGISLAFSMRSTR